MKKLKKFTLLETDFYQISMVFAYVVNNDANRMAGFEGFVRKINPLLPQNFYIFNGKDEIEEYIDNIKMEIQDPKLPEVIIEFIKPKLKDLSLIDKFRKNWNKLKFDFEYSVVENGTLVFPYVPVFQYKGPIWLGQLIETMVTNIYNGKTAKASLDFSYAKTNLISKEDYYYLSDLMIGEDSTIKDFSNKLKNKVEVIRNSNREIVILEAAFRRTFSKEVADLASKIAVDNGWNGSSNTSLLFEDFKKYKDKVGGTMAHSFVMSYESEKIAFQKWDNVFPGTTLLVDTYDVKNALNTIKKLLDENKITIPNDIRIDNTPFEKYIKLFEDEFKRYYPNTELFISGDVDENVIRKLKEYNYNYRKTMVGTKLIYQDDLVSLLNAGFVYKLVEVESKKNEIRYPEKKAENKKNYSSLKFCEYNEKEDKLYIYLKSNKIGFKNLDKMKSTTVVEFVRKNINMF